jgi:hypothetical protein
MRNVFAPILMIVLLASCAPVTQTTAPEVSPPPSATRLPPSATSIQATKTPIPASFTPTLIPAPLTKTPAYTATPIPFPTKSPTPTPGPSPTPSVLTASSPDGNPVECYKGPDIGYITVTKFKTAEIVGIDEAGKWWYLKIDQGQGRHVWCWVLQKNVAIGGDFSYVPVTEPEAAQVTDVSIYIRDESPDAFYGYVQTVPCGKKADKPVFHFLGRISTDGPIQKVKYVWETNAPAKFSPEQTRVQGWRDPREIKLDLSVPAQEGTYFLRLWVQSPNEMLWIVQFVVKCQ